MSKTVENRKDVECAMQHMGVLATVMQHLSIHISDYHDCGIRQIVGEISLDIYNDMQTYAPDIAAQVGPPPSWECTCGLHDGGQVIIG